jgi:aromatic ring-opening dioxygenase LigB subunit
MLVWACIAPHGGELIPELANGNPGRMAVTRAAMEDLGERCREAAPETVVIYTPHGLYIDDYVSVSVTRYAGGASR